MNFNLIIRFVKNTIRTSNNGKYILKINPQTFTHHQIFVLDKCHRIEQLHRDNRYDSRDHMFSLHVLNKFKNIYIFYDRIHRKLVTFNH